MLGSMCSRIDSPCIQELTPIKVVTLVTGVVLLVSIAASAVLLTLPISPYAHFSVGVITGSSLGLFVGGAVIWCLLPRQLPVVRSVSTDTADDASSPEALLIPPSFFSPRAADLPNKRKRLLTPSPSMGVPPDPATSLSPLTAPILCRSPNTALCPSSFPGGEESDRSNSAPANRICAVDELQTTAPLPSPRCSPTPLAAPHEPFGARPLLPAAIQDASLAIAPLSLVTGSSDPVVSTEALVQEMQVLSDQVQGVICHFIESYAHLTDIQSEYRSKKERYLQGVRTSFEGIQNLVQAIAQTDPDRLNLFYLQMNLLCVGLCYMTHQELISHIDQVHLATWLGSLQQILPQNVLLEKMVAYVRRSGGTSEEIAAWRQKIHNQATSPISAAFNAGSVVVLVDYLASALGLLGAIGKAACQVDSENRPLAAITSIRIGDPKGGVSALLNKIKAVYEKTGWLGSRALWKKGILKIILTQDQRGIDSIVDVLCLTPEEKPRMKSCLSAIVHPCLDPLFYATVGDASKHLFKTEPHPLYEAIRKKSQRPQFTALSSEDEQFLSKEGPLVIAQFVVTRLNLLLSRDRDSKK